MIGSANAFDVVKIMQLFDDKKEFLDKKSENIFKELLAEDAEKLSFSDLCSVLEFYRDDRQFRKFLANVILDRLEKGQNYT